MTLWIQIMRDGKPGGIWDHEPSNKERIAEYGRSLHSGESFFIGGYFRKVVKGDVF